MVDRQEKIDHEQHGPYEGASSFTYEKREEYVSTMEKQLEALCHRIYELRAKSAGQSGAHSHEPARCADVLFDSYKETRAQLDTLRNTPNAEAWRELKDTFEAGFRSLIANVERAIGKIGL